MKPLSAPICAMAMAALPFGAAVGAVCTQDRAVYGNEGAGYELAFMPAASDAVATSHQFQLTATQTGLVMQGFVMEPEESAASMGTLMYQCPEGDVTGADLRACTVWEGLINAGEQQSGEPLPPHDQPAAQHIRLVDLSNRLPQSSAWGVGKADAIPGDIFVLKGCIP